MARSGVLPTTYIVCLSERSGSHTLQSALENGQDARFVQFDFGAGFDRANHQGILYKPCSVCIGDSNKQIKMIY